MRRIFMASCLSTTLAASGAMAQAVPENPIGQAGQAIQRANSNVQNTIRDGANRARDAATQTRDRARQLGDQVTDERVGGQGQVSGQVGAQTRLNQSGQSAGLSTDAAARANINRQSQGAGVSNQMSTQAGVNRIQAGGSGQVTQSGTAQGQTYQGRAYQGQAMRSGISGYHSRTGQTMASNRVYRLLHDSSGREFICVNGQRVYFNNTVANSAPQNDRYRAGYGSYDTESQQLNESNSAGPDSTMQPALGGTQQSATQQNGGVNSTTSGSANAGSSGVDASTEAGAQLGEMNESRNAAGRVAAESEVRSDLDTSANADAATDLNSNLRSDASIDAKSSSQLDAAGGSGDVNASGALNTETNADAGAGAIDAGVESAVDGGVDLNQ